MPMLLECGAESSGASSTIGDTVFDFVLATREIFRTDFGLHEITSPVMSDTIPKEDDKEIWITNVQFQVQYDKRWATEPIAPVLREIGLAIRGRQNVSQTFVDIALRDGDD